MEYLVQYGQAALLGRFLGPEEPFVYGDRVIVQSPRGQEIGTVLGLAVSRFAHLVDSQPSGRLLRAVSTEDQIQEQRLRQQAEQLLAQAQNQADALGLTVTFLDAEILFDQRISILQLIHWADCQIDTLLEELSQQVPFAIRIQDMTWIPSQESKGCSTCGSEHGGCSSCGTSGGCSKDSCSRGKATSSEEMTAYFANLRSQMEATQGRIPL